jgi:hypothetical protein
MNTFGRQEHPSSPVVYQECLGLLEYPEFYPKFSHFVGLMAYCSGSSSAVMTSKNWEDLWTALMEKTNNTSTDLSRYFIQMKLAVTPTETLL